LQRRDVQRLKDIKEAIGRIRRYWESSDPNGAVSDMAWDAVLYNFAVVGEAVKALSAEVRELAPDADWSPAAKMRDFVIHQYPETNLDVIAATVRRDLPALEAVVDSLLERESDQLR
jgi:uncharacterized protein with HEPN domain